MDTLPGRGDLKQTLAALLEKETVDEAGRHRLLEFLQQRRRIPIPSSYIS